MNIEQFNAAYKEFRNGANFLIRHPLSPAFAYSDGVKDCAEAGCYWFLDILATELPAAFRERPEQYMCTVYLKANNNSAVIVGEFTDDDPNPYRRVIDYTDMPDGVWMFYVCKDGGLTMILPSEY